MKYSHSTSMGLGQQAVCRRGAMQKLCGNIARVFKSRAVEWLAT